MAGKNATSKAKAGSTTRNERAPFVGYVNITLTAEDAEEFKGWFEQADMVADAYLDMFDLGYQATIKYDHENEAFSCSISNWHIEAIDSGVIYTARSATVEGATWKAVFVWDRKLSRNLNNGHVKGTRKDAF